MDKDQINSEHEIIPCNVCMKEIPVTEAKSVEASDYVAYFCGLDCYEKWSKEIKEELEV